MIIKGIVTRVFDPIRGERKNDSTSYAFVPFVLESKEQRFTRDGTPYTHTDTFVVNFNCTSNELNLNVGDNISADVNFTITERSGNYFQKAFCKYVRVIG